jgi:hypothetical protein
MLHTFERLLDGDTALLPHYRLAREWWRSVWAAAPAGGDALAAVLVRERPWFERNCGGREHGAEAMVVAAFASLYSTRYGFGDNATRAAGLLVAFERADLPDPYRATARQVATAYGVPGVSAVRPVGGSSCNA